MKIEKKHGKIKQDPLKTVKIDKKVVEKVNSAWIEWQNYKKTAKNIEKTT